jgi:hypothetical protein
MLSKTVTTATDFDLDHAVWCEGMQRDSFIDPNLLGSEISICFLMSEGLI